MSTAKAKAFYQWRNRFEDAGAALMREFGAPESVQRGPTVMLAWWRWEDHDVMLRSALSQKWMTVTTHAPEGTRDIVVTDDLPVVIGELRTWAVANGVLP